MTETKRTAVQRYSDSRPAFSAHYATRRRKRKIIISDFRRFFKGRWYKYYQREDEAETKLSAGIEEHQRTRQTLRETLDNMQKMKGALNNG